MASVNVPLPFEAYQGPEPNIFVSYAHKGGASICPLISELRERGYRVWCDEGIDTGNEWPEEIAKALLGAAHFVVFLRRLSGDHYLRSLNRALPATLRRVPAPAPD